jgi:hypothetical protein
MKTNFTIRFWVCKIRRTVLKDFYFIFPPLNMSGHGLSLVVKRPEPDQASNARMKYLDRPRKHNVENNGIANSPVWSLTDYLGVQGFATKPHH